MYLYVDNNPVNMDDFDGFLPLPRVIVINGRYYTRVAGDKHAHDAVCEYISTLVPGSVREFGIPGAGKNGGIGYGDIVIVDKYVWEVKTNTSSNRSQGRRALRRYTNRSAMKPGYSVVSGYHILENGSGKIVIYPDTHSKIKHHPSRGLIVYDVYREMTQQEVTAYQTAIAAVIVISLVALFAPQAAPALVYAYATMQ